MTDSTGWRIVMAFAGVVEEFDGVEGTIRERLEFFDLSGPDRSFSCSLTPREINVPDLLLAGHDLQDALIAVLDPNGAVVLAGRPDPGVRWARFGEPVGLTVVEAPWYDESTIPQSWDQRVSVRNEDAISAAVAGLNQLQAITGTSTVNWPAAFTQDLRGDPKTPPVISALGWDVYASRVEGRVGPVVWGAPGYQDGETWPASPAFWVDTTTGAERLMVARHRVAASAVTIYGPCWDGEVRAKVADVVHVRDSQGVLVAVAEIEGLLGRGVRLNIGFSHSPSGTYEFEVDHTIAGVSAAETINVSWSGGADGPATAVACKEALEAEFRLGVVTIVQDDNTPVLWLDLPLGDDLENYADQYPGAPDPNVPVVATIEFSGVNRASPDDFRPDLLAEWWAAWHAGEGLPGGAGDVIRYLLAQTAVRVDAAGLESARRALNGYRLAGFLDEVVPVIEYLTSQLAWLPISWVQGRDGLRVWLYDPDLPPVATLDASDEFDVDTDPRLTSATPVRQVELGYRTQGDTDGRKLRTRQRTLYTALADRRGVVEQLETHLCDDRVSAERAAALRQRALHRRHREISGTLPRSWDWLRAGDVVDVYAPDWGVAGRGVVVEVTDWAEARIGVSAIVWRDPAQPFSSTQDPFPEPEPEPITYPPLRYLAVRATRILGELPDPGSAAIPNRATIAPPTGYDPPDPLEPSSGGTVDTGYPPDESTTMTRTTGAQLMQAWLHEQLGPPAEEGPYNAINGMAACIHSMDINRASTADVLVVLRGGRGTSGSDVSWFHVDVLTGDNIRIRARGASALETITPTAITIPGIISGTGNKEALFSVAARWWWVDEDVERGWELIVLYDLGAGAGLQAAYNGIFSETDTAAAPTNNITRVQTQPPTTGGIFWTPSSDRADFHQLVRAIWHDYGRDATPFLELA